MRYFNILGSLVFLLIGYMVLIKGEFFSLVDHKLFTYGAFLCIAYLATQGIGLLFRKPGKQSGFYMDLIFSVLPLFIVYEAFVRSASKAEHYEFFRDIYFSVVMLDLVIFTAVAYRFAMMMDEYVMHDE